jgi:hypothetical protein
MSIFRTRKLYEVDACRPRQERTNPKTRKTIPRRATISASLAAFALLTTVFAGQMLKAGVKAAAQQNEGAGLSTGLVSLAPGQSARLAVVNVGGKDVSFEFIFVPVTEQGKSAVPIQCDAIVSSGNAASAKYGHPGGANAVEFYAQARVGENAGDLKDLVPSLQIIDDQTGRTEQLLSGSDFVSFRPIFNPPF